MWEVQWSVTGGMPLPKGTRSNQAVFMTQEALSSFLALLVKDQLALVSLEATPTPLELHVMVREVGLAASPPASSTKADAKPSASPPTTG